MKRLPMMVVAAMAAIAAQAGDWMTLELKTGKVEYPDIADVDEANDIFAATKYKTTHIAFRRIAAGLYPIEDTNARWRLENDAWASIYPVTAAQYALVCDPAAAVDDSPAGRTPATKVSWCDLRGPAGAAEPQFGAVPDGCALARLSSRVDAFVFDLPCQLLWEAAARARPAGDRARTDWRRFFAADPDLGVDALGEYAWYRANYEEPDANGIKCAVREVGQKKPNAFGLFDVYGNVDEWCLDMHSGKPNERITRGGFAHAKAVKCSSTRRSYNAADAGYPFVGLRLFATVKKQ